MDIATAKKLLAEQSKQDLIKIIARLSNYSDDAESWLLEYCGKHGAADGRQLAAEKQMRHEWDIAWEIIEEANEFGGTYENREDDACDALERMETLIKKCKFTWDFRKPIVDEMLEQIFEGNSGFEDLLMDHCEMLCKTRDEKLYLAERLKASASDYYKTYAAKMFLKLGKEDEFLEVQSQNLRYGEDYIRLAEYYRDKQDEEKAIRIMEQALQKAEGRMDTVYNWLFRTYRRKKQDAKIDALYRMAVSKNKDVDTMTQLMYEHYKDDYDRKKEYLLKLAEVCDGREARRWYDVCKRELRAQDFSKASNHLHEVLKKRNMNAYLQLCIDEGNLREVLDFLLAAPPAARNSLWGLDAGHGLTKQLANAFPEEVCEIYWNECEGLCRESNKKNYQCAVSVLKEIRAICKAKKLLDSWNARFGQFMERHKKKKLLMGYINEIKSLRMAEGKKETKEELQDLKCGEEQVELFSDQAGK
ncbi:MAG: hypothetical protein J6N99_04720 [Schwartzia sp.]|nr:hypothetical protein [Schwartzia sp. (in: firmicutes)]